MGSSPTGPCGLLLYGALAPRRTSTWPLAPAPPPSTAPAPPLGSYFPDGDLCWLYATNKPGDSPYELRVNVTACECYAICASPEQKNCVYR